MSKKAKCVYQFKITLKDIKPAIWRQIQVPETYSFWDLHVAIQDSMGWLDYHLHQFKIVNPQTENENLIGIPSDDGWEDEPILPGWEVLISSYFSLKNKKANYEYDFGDGWEHEVKFEKILPIEPDTKYPLCLAGERACPPEDCGGVHGFRNLLRILKNPRHKEYQSMILWIGHKFNAEDFNPNLVKFDNPKMRWKKAFQEN